MYGQERFIGEWLNTSGGYPPTEMIGLSKRNGSGTKLFKFTTVFDDNSGYYITDPAIVREIENRLLEAEASETDSEREGHLEELEAYLYRQIAEVFGMMAIVAAAKREMSNAYETGLANGKAAAQKEMRRAMGVRT